MLLLPVTIMLRQTKFEVSEEDAAKGASVNATTGEFTWQNDGVALTANKTINVKVTVTYTWVLRLVQFL